MFMHKKTKTSKVFAMLMAAATMLTMPGMSSMAAGYEDVGEGTYTVDGDLTAYVSAMGGVEFGAPLLVAAGVDVAANGDATLTMYLRKSSVTIYGVTCDTFIDPNYPMKMKDSGGDYISPVSYTTSEDTALNPNNEQINYVDSVTFALSEVSDTYDLSLYVNSNVMGVQFGNGSNYYSGLTVNWNTLVEGSADPGAAEGDVQSAYITYEALGGYVVSIPSIITVESSSRIGDYVVELTSFDASENAYVTVSAASAGVLTYGDKSVNFENVLEGDELNEQGQLINGRVTVTSSTSTRGEYTGTLDFNITYYQN